jgi:hypothetical protein
MGFDWFKAHSNGILRGSLATSDWYIQLIWVKLLAIESETHLRDGCLHFKPGTPMSREYLASQCMVDIEHFNRAIDEYLSDYSPNGEQRITILPDGTIRINNWSLYQADNGTKSLKKEVSELKNQIQEISNDTVKQSIRPHGITNDFIQR